jgi:hemerythrin-like domain-containing protein
MPLASGHLCCKQASMNILKTLKKEHREIKRLFKMIERTPVKKTRQKIFMTLMNTLDAHMIAEEDVLYSRLRENEKTRGEILEAFEEHHLTKTIADEIANLSVDDESWMAKTRVLKEMIDRHVKAEENKVFKKAKKLFSRQELAGLNHEFESRRDEFLVDQSPRSIESKAA